MINCLQWQEQNWIADSYKLAKVSTRRDKRECIEGGLVETCGKMENKWFCFPKKYIESNVVRTENDKNRLFWF